MITVLPPAFLEKLHLIIQDPILFDQIIQSFQHKKPVCIRVNTLKSTVQEIKALFDFKHILYHTVAWYEDILVLSNSNTKIVTDLLEYQEGKIYIQSLSSMIPVLVLDPKSNEKILDMAASPGSKTTQIAQLMKNRGELVANDLGSRVMKLKRMLEIYGVTNTKVTQLAGQSLWQKYPEYFNKVLLDAPCSMEGMFNVNNSKTISHWSEKKVKNLSKLQKWLLRSAVSATKVGGTIIYSTCTISPEENEDVIQWILEKESGSICLENINLKCDVFPGISQWKNKQFNNSISKTKRILPNEDMEAFFVAKFRKIKSNINQEE